MKFHLLGICLCLYNFIFAQSVIQLPEPIGNYHISCIRNIELSDTTRTERALNKNGSFRELNFDLYYPTDTTPGRYLGYCWWTSSELCQEHQLIYSGRQLTRTC